MSYPVDPDAPPQLSAPGDTVPTQILCDRCWLRYNVPLRAVVASTPTVQSLLRRYDLGPLRTPLTGYAEDVPLDWDSHRE